MWGASSCLGRLAQATGPVRFCLALVFCMAIVRARWYPPWPHHPLSQSLGTGTGLLHPPGLSGLPREGRPREAIHACTAVHCTVHESTALSTVNPLHCKLSTHCTVHCPHNALSADHTLHCPLSTQCTVHCPYNTLSTDRTLQCQLSTQCTVNCSRHCRSLRLHSSRSPYRPSAEWLLPQNLKFATVCHKGYGSQKNEKSYGL
jgi:hypothetical protein